MRLAMLLAVAILTPCLAAQDGWREEQSSAQWAPRTAHTVTEFNGKLWVINGWSGNTQPTAGDNIWSSADGINWVEELTVVPWIRRSGHCTVVFNNRLWVLGGINSTNSPGYDPTYPQYRHDVWSSPDGVNWTLEAIAPWHGRGFFASVVYNGRIWIMGGYSIVANVKYTLNDVWSSSDGVTWKQEVAAAAWMHRSGHCAAVFDNRMWISGGGSVGSQLAHTDVWSSTEGVNWTQEAPVASWVGRSNHTFESYRGRLWIFGGLGDDGFPFFNDSWSSFDGVNWKHESPDSSLPARSHHGSAVFKNRLWVFGGASNVARYNDVWSYGLHVHTDAATECLVDTPYSATFEAFEGDGPYAWSISVGVLPHGLTLHATDTATVTITGTPIQVRDRTFTIRVEDQATGDWAEKSFTLTVNPPPELELPTNNAGGGASCTAAPSQAGPGGQGTSTAVLWLAWLAALTAATIALRHRAVGGQVPVP